MSIAREIVTKQTQSASTLENSAGSNARENGREEVLKTRDDGITAGNVFQDPGKALRPHLYQALITSAWMIL
jgi:hypothetical protein